MRVSTLAARDEPRLRGAHSTPYPNIRHPYLTVPLLLGGFLGRPLEGCAGVVGCDPVPRVPLTCPWWTRCRCPHH